jgi:NAD(P)-dependent dehydrogenase (short-subunit alcohol dehydrogenase family)
MWTLNAATAFVCCREAVKRLRAGGAGGRIVNVVSRQATDPRAGAGMIAYASGKCALAGLTLALAAEVADAGILVNAVAPGILDTPANRRAMPDADRSGWAPLEDAAATIAFLASPRNTLVRGAILPLF